jgi:hypothetical protein
MRADRESLRDDALGNAPKGPRANRVMTRTPLQPPLPPQAPILTAPRYPQQRPYPSSGYVGVPVHERHPPPNSGPNDFRHQGPDSLRNDGLPYKRDPPSIRGPIYERPPYNNGPVPVRSTHIYWVALTDPRAGSHQRRPISLARLTRPLFRRRRTRCSPVSLIHHPAKHPVGILRRSMVLYQTSRLRRPFRRFGRLPIQWPTRLPLSPRHIFRHDLPRDCMAKCAN